MQYNIRNLKQVKNTEIEKNPHLRVFLLYSLTLKGGGIMRNEQPLRVCKANPPPLTQGRLLRSVHFSHPVTRCRKTDADRTNNTEGGAPDTSKQSPFTGFERKRKTLPLPCFSSSPQSLWTLRGPQKSQGF